MAFSEGWASKCEEEGALWQIRLISKGRIFSTKFEFKEGAGGLGLNVF